MTIVVDNSRGNKYVRIVESYRDPITKKPKFRTIKNLGRLDVLEKDNPNIIQELRDKFKEDKANKQLTSEVAKKIVDNILLNEENNSTFKLVNYGSLIYHNLWNELKLNDFFNNLKTTRMTKINDVVSHLCISRILKPDSKLETFLEKSNYIKTIDTSLNSFYRCLEVLNSNQEEIEKYINKRIDKLTNRELTVVFYDVTTYYFESVKQDDLKRFGFSKDNKINEVQVVMGLLIDTNGIPVTYELFSGNTQDSSTLKTILIKLKEEFKIKKVILTADRGLNSKGNLALLEELGYEYVVAYRIRTSSKNIKDIVLSEEDYVWANENFKYKKYNNEFEIKIDKQKKIIKNEIILTWSRNRAEKDSKDRERLVDKALKLTEKSSTMKSELKKGGKKYINVELDKLSINQEKIDYDKQFDGYYAICSSNKEKKVEEILNIYNKLWKIEESFRVLKTEFKARPVYHYTEKRIKGHFVLCFISLVLERYLEYLLKNNNIEMSTEKIIKTINNANLAVYEKNKEQLYMKQEESEELNKILDTLNMKKLKNMGTLKSLKF